MSEILMRVDNLTKHYDVGKKEKLKAVNNVSFTIHTGETFGLVGESGSGKSTIAKLIMRLEKPTEGKIFLGDTNLLELKSRNLLKARRDLQMVFQNPFDALNRRKRVRDIISLPLKVHTNLNEKEREVRVIELLGLVGLRPEMIERFPHEISGGQCQRVGIARAIALNPKMLILDESVSAVDVSIQAQILNLLRELQEKLNLTYLFISHDLSIVRYMSHKIAVLYQGEIAEFGTRENLFSNPVHPYTHTLMNSIPDPFHEKSGKVSEIGTGDESIDKVSTGCSFRSRCAIGAQKEICMSINPGLTPNTSAHELVACHFPTTSSEYAQALKSLTHSAG
jgi:oligopeptide/dipeptide ABC transporter ATP-binding protein